MISLIVALVSAPAASSQQQAAVRAYQECLAPIVRGNELAGEKAYQPLETILERIKVRCSKERAAAREALAAYVVANHPALPRQPSEADKDELMLDATIRWANSVVHGMASKMDDEAHAPN
jgi:hypothetical protein